MKGQPGFFDVQERLKRLSDLGDQLETYGRLVDFEAFRPELVAAVGYSAGAKGGRPPFDVVLMFKILVIQAQNSLSDERAEYLISDRLSFMRFLGLTLSDPVPDAKTIWLFRERLVKAGAIEGLFKRFDAMIRAAGYIPMSGQLIDSTCIAAPKQRNTKEEKAALKAGETPEHWKANPSKKRQKDKDARWTVKYTKAKVAEDGSKPSVDLAIPAFGYKNHVSTDRAFGLIRTWTVTDAAAFDGARLPDLLDPTNTARVVWADTAYRSKKNEEAMASRGFRSEVHRKKPVGKGATAKAIKRTERSNNRKSKVRAHIEHVFAVQKQKMGVFVRTIGIERARLKIGMANIVYNMRRFIWLEGRSVTA
jgi:IS5 family transposase